ncbi:MAG: PaaI family thioesterase [Mesorhizobium sp.]|nr:PaaI family thioesterase [Mesorhizobium sp.]
MQTVDDEDNPPEGFVQLADRPEIEKSAGPFYERILEDGRRQLGFRVSARKLNKMGACHGGVLAMFADIQGSVVKRRLGITADTPTINLGMDFVAPAREGAWVWSEPGLVRHTGGMIFFQATVHADSEVCMRVNGIYRIRPSGHIKAAEFSPS